MGRDLDEGRIGEEAKEPAQYAIAELYSVAQTLTIIEDIGMLVALKSWPELTIHTKGAIRNGLTDVEIREAVLQTFLYCGAPAGLEAMRVTEKAIREMVESGEYTNPQLQY